MRHSIPRLPVRRDWAALWVRTLLATLALVAALVMLACEESPPSTDPTDPCAADPTSCIPPDPIPVPTDCGDGLAAVDLSGVCRATPKATMGALEAVP